MKWKAASVIASRAIPLNGLPSSSGPADALFNKAYPAVDIAKATTAINANAMVRVRRGVSRRSNAPLMNRSGSVASSVTGMLPHCRTPSQYSAKPTVGEGTSSTLLSCAHVPATHEAAMTQIQMMPGMGLLLISQVLSGLRRIVPDVAPWSTPGRYFGHSSIKA